MPKNRKTKKSPLKKLNRETFDELFSSPEKLDAYADSIIESVRERTSGIVTTAKKGQNERKSFPKFKSKAPFSLSDLIGGAPYPNVTTASVSEKKASHREKEEKPVEKVKVTYQSKTKIEKKKGLFILNFLKGKLKESPKKVVTPPPKKKASVMTKEVVKAKRKRQIKHKDMDVNENKNVVKNNPSHTVTSENLEKRFKERQKKIQDLFNDKGSLS